jgi:two-component system phosphate regulon response regulator OmpR
MQYHILLIDDDEEIGQLLSEYLNKNNYSVSIANNTVMADELLDIFKFDLIILDVLMPNETGIEFLKRKFFNTPVIMLTALADVDDRINGLESGAEDYVAKPFEPKELLIRIEKIISRFKKELSVETKVKFGNFEFDLENKNLSSDGKLISLTTSQRDLLNIFTKNINIVISREELAKQLNNINARTIDTQITRLRTKIEKNPKSPEFLQTIRNQGYVLWG